MNKIYKEILTKISENKKMLAVLLDPEKCIGDVLENTLNQLELSLPDVILIGGSTRSFTTDFLIDKLSSIPVPKILFPGDVSQFSPLADAMLFLSLLSGRNSDYLIGQHVISALEIKRSGIEIIPTAYILIDGGRLSAVERVSNTSPMDVDATDKIIATAVAGELLGMKMVYLEAGSGANHPIKSTTIAAVKRALNIPLIVGGGIREAGQLKNALDAGADMVVVGNAFEQSPEKISEFVAFIKTYNSRVAE